MSLNEEINILLLGETGVGKSTFINGFANYLTYKTLGEAKNEDIISLIPSSFTVTDEEYEEKLVEFGKDDNEANIAGQSATQLCKCFIFPFGERLIRLIDTPGVGDTRGIDQDKLNFDNILAFIGQYNELHAICILLKPNNARITVTFEFCIKQLLCHLQKSASKNIVFLFTNARGTFYRPGDTAPSLRAILKEIKESPPHVDIAFKKDTIYCLDNEAFRFLVALKNDINFADDEVENFSKSWITSAKECLRLMQYIIGTKDGKPGLPPHKVKDTVSVNEARRLIVGLSQPLADIAQNIEDNLKVLDQHREDIKAESSNIDKLRQKLYVPKLDLKLTYLDRPRTVCANSSCCKIYNVGNLNKYDYIQKCHNPCGLSGVPREVLGDPHLLNCSAINTSSGYCNKCGCNYKIHLHIYYESQVVENRIVDENVSHQIRTKEDTKRKASEMIADIENRCDVLRNEKAVITKTTAKFAHFLKNNAIAPYNDAFEAYLEHLIENEKSLSKRGSNNQEIIKGLQNMLNSYKHEKNILDSAIKEELLETCAVSAKEVFDGIKDLFALKISGKKIKELQLSQENARKSELSFKGQEIVHKPKTRNGIATGFISWFF